MSRLPFTALMLLLASCNAESPAPPETSYPIESFYIRTPGIMLYEVNGERMTLSELEARVQESVDAGIAPTVKIENDDGSRWQEMGAAIGVFNDRGINRIEVTSPPDQQKP